MPLARRLREDDRGPLRGHRQLDGRARRGRRAPPPSSCTASPATSRGRTWTSPARPTTTAARTRPRAARAGASACWSSWPAANRPPPSTARAPDAPEWVGVRLVGLWILLVAVYATTLGIPARPGWTTRATSRITCSAAESIVSDRDVDLADEYAERAYASLVPAGAARPTAARSTGRLVEPHGVGFALLIAPAYAIGGARAVQGEMLALLAFAFVLGAALARRMVPGAVGDGRRRRWSASRRPRSPRRRRSRPASRPRCCWPAAALCALAVRENPRRRYVLDRRAAAWRRCPGWAGRSWPPGAIVAWALVAWTLRERRRFAALVAGEALAASLVFYATVNDRFYGGHHPALGGQRGDARPAARVTWSASRAWRGCGWTATSGCCAGRRCSGWCSSRPGCCTAPGATNWRASPPPAARRRRARGCCWPWSARSWSSRRC